MLFIVSIEAHNQGHIFSNFINCANGRGRVSIFLTLVPLLFQTLMFFLFALSLFIRGLAISGGRRVRWL